MESRSEIKKKKEIGKGVRKQTIERQKKNRGDVGENKSENDKRKGSEGSEEVMWKYGEEAATKVWPSVDTPSGTAIGQAKLVIGSDLAKSLFAAGNEIG